MSGHSSRSANGLRAALASPHPELQEVAQRLILKALRESDTQAEAADRLLIDVRTLRRIQKEYPEIFLSS